MPDNPTRSPLQLWTWVSIAVFVISLLALMALQYQMPEEAGSFFGLNHDGVRMFREAFGQSSSEMEPGAFTLAFRLLLTIVWASYAAVVVLGMRGAIPKAKAIIGLVAITSVVLAVMWPASLSVDSFIYIGYAKLKIVYGENPYVSTPGFLSALGDPVGKFMVWDIPSPYASIWTIISMGVVSLLKNAGIWWQDIAMKLIEAGTLVGAALAGRRIAGHLSPGRGNLALLAIGLNPLLLIEGPGNGHNDMLMVCLLMISVALFMGRRWLLGALLLGLSVGIKFVPITTLPWLLMEYLRGEKHPRKAAIGAAIVVLAILPTALCYLPFMGDGPLLTGVIQRGTMGVHRPGLERELTGNASHVAAGMLARLLFGNILLPTLVFIGLTVWLLFNRRPGRWLAAWVPFSVLLIPATMGNPFPWYLIWPCALSLICWDRLSAWLAALGLLVTFACTLLYTFPYL